MEWHDQDKDALIAACRKMETIAIEIFADYEWRFNNRICFEELFDCFVITGL
jgi:hypothetical protein